MYEDVFAALNAAGVSYVVVGGVAVLLQGHARLTVDLDLVIDLAAASARKAIDALVGLGLQPRLPVDPRDFADEAVRADWVATRNLQVFSLFDPRDPLREVDVFATYPLPFDQLRDAAVVVSVGQQAVPVASVEHLIEMKRRAGRALDLDDVDALVRLQGTNRDE